MIHGLVIRVEKVVTSALVATVFAFSACRREAAFSSGPAIPSPPAASPPTVGDGAPSALDASAGSSFVTDARVDTSSEAPIVDAPAGAGDSSSDLLLSTRKLRVFDLGRAGVAPACDPTPMALRVVRTRTGDRCRIVRPKKVTATVDPDAKIASVIDGNACTAFRSEASAPQTVELTLPSNESVSALLFVPEMTSASAGASHVIELESEPRGRKHRFLAEATYSSSAAYLVLLNVGSSNKVRITTVESDSTIAWREISILSCNGFALVQRDTPEITPKPRMKLVTGRGACKTDRDCVPDACCAAKSCVARKLAPRCGLEGRGCGQACSESSMDCGKASCVCHEGTCSAWYHGTQPGLRNASSDARRIEP